MPKHRTTLRAAASFLATALLALTAHACSSAMTAGAPCAVAADCYPGVDTAKIKGTVLCLDKVPGGYCTHLCAGDGDCCAASGECPEKHTEVCAPFESTGMMMCFLSCEASDVGSLDENAYCAQYAGDAFGCRSTGGGSKNRKICSP